MLEILSYNIKTHEQAKIKLFAKLFANSALAKNSKTPYKEGFVRIVANLSTDHIVLFSHIYDKCKDFTEEDRAQRRDKVTVRELMQLVKIPEHRIIAYCQGLIRFALIYDWSVGRFDYQRDSYGLTEYGREFASFLRDPE